MHCGCGYLSPAPSGLSAHLTPDKIQGTDHNTPVSARSRFETLLLSLPPVTVCRYIRVYDARHVTHNILHRCDIRCHKLPEGSDILLKYYDIVLVNKLTIIIRVVLPIVGKKCPLHESYLYFLRPIKPFITVLTGTSTSRSFIYTSTCTALLTSSFSASY